jgi:hypothetical protein
MKDFIEQRIITAVRGILTGRVNEFLRAVEYQIPFIEFSDYNGEFAVVPVLTLSSCELSEKERIIRQEAYSLTVTFSLQETPKSELFCFAYSSSLERAIKDDPTLGGVVDRAMVTGKKYLPPKKPHNGEGWEVIVMLRITVEGIKE